MQTINCKFVTENHSYRFYDCFSMHLWTSTEEMLCHLSVVEKHIKFQWTAKIGSNLNIKQNIIMSWICIKQKKIMVISFWGLDCQSVKVTTHAKVENPFCDDDCLSGGDFLKLFLKSVRRYFKTEYLCQENLKKNAKSLRS